VVGFFAEVGFTLRFLHLMDLIRMATLGFLEVPTGSLLMPELEARALWLLLLGSIFPEGLHQEVKFPLPAYQNGYLTSLRPWVNGCECSHRSIDLGAPLLRLENAEGY